MFKTGRGDPATFNAALWERSAGAIRGFGAYLESDPLSFDDGPELGRLQFCLQELTAQLKQSVIVLPLFLHLYARELATQLGVAGGENDRSLEVRREYLARIGRCFQEVGNIPWEQMQKPETWLQHLTTLSLLYEEMLTGMNAVTVS